MSDSNSQHGSVTGWLRDLEAGDRSALNALADRYFKKLSQAADLEMSGKGSPPVQGDDVAIVALMRLRKNLLAEKSRGRIPNRDSFWLFMLAILRSVIIDFHRKHSAEKRGGGKVANLSDILPSKDDTTKLIQFVDRQPDQESLMALKDSVEFLLQKKLKIGMTREVARLKLEGLSNEQVAEQLGINISSVVRKLRRIEEIWKNELGIVERVKRDDSNIAD